MQFRLQRVSQERSDSDSEYRPSQTGDTDLLDAYSRAVIGVVDAVSPALISVSGAGSDRPAGSGSGFIIAPEGYAVTNSHVVAGRRRLSALTGEGDRLLADVIGDDPATDVALLAIGAGDLPCCTTGDAGALRVGQLVIAMGSPLGLHSTVSTGVVSALGRSMRGVDGRVIENIVQHSAPINPGNSGGPLVNSSGQVVGINTAIIAMAQGIGFAVPSNAVQWVVSEFLEHGQVRRRTLGVTARTIPLSRSLVRDLDLLAGEAVEVVDVEKAGPAGRAGIVSGDLIVALQGRIITSVDDIHRLLVTWPAEKPITTTIVRNRALRDLVVELDA